MCQCPENWALLPETVNCGRIKDNMDNEMLRAFWTWNPVCSGSRRRFDEPHAMRHNRWLFDKSTWQRMFRAMSACGFNAIFIANTHPFPFMIEYDQFPEAAMVDRDDLEQYQKAYRWIFQTAAGYDIRPYVLFFSIYYPDCFAEKRGLSEDDRVKPDQLAVDYTAYCVAKLLETYPELGGIVGEASETIEGDRSAFIRNAIAAPIAASSSKPDLIIRGWCADPKDLVQTADEFGSQARYSVKYTWEHLVGEAPDPMFRSWTAAAGPERVLAEFWISNYEPLACFSFSTAEGILRNLSQMGCSGFSLHPLSLYEWPFTSDRDFRHQWQRDLVWYQIWGGAGIAELVEHATPRWLQRHTDLIGGLEAGSRILQTVALYFGGDKQNQWHPQFCTIRYGSQCRLFTIADMVAFPEQEMFWGRNWRQELTAEKVAHLPDALQNPIPEAYGPMEFIDTLTELVARAEADLRKAWSRIRGEQELPCIARNLESQTRLGTFWIERMRAAIARARREDETALRHMALALEAMTAAAVADRRHRDGFRAITGRTAIVGEWDSVLTALEAELSDAAKNEWRSGENYLVHRLSGDA